MKRQFLFLIRLLFTFKAAAGDNRKQEVDSLLAKSMEYLANAANDDGGCEALTHLSKV
ncbi:MAG: hypothetical protein ACN6ON_08515 [Sphingobacterium sp.]